MLLFDGGYVDFSGSTPRYCWYTKDHLGSVRAVADADGNVFATYAYSAYGEDFAVNAPVSGSSVSTTNGSSAGQVANGGWTIGENIFLPTVTYSPNEGSDWQPFKFGGKESLTRVGLDLYDFGARMYSPSNMRWMTMDPLCEKHFDISPYAYCSGDPINRFDPDGMFDKKMFWSGVMDVATGALLTVGGAGLCVATEGVGAALGGTGMIVEGASEICGGVTAIIMGCVLDPPEEGELRFTPTGIVRSTAQGIDLAVGNENWEVYNAVSNLMLLISVKSSVDGVLELLQSGGAYTITQGTQDISTLIELIYNALTADNSSENQPNNNGGSSSNMSENSGSNNSANETKASDPSNSLWYNPEFN